MVSGAAFDLGVWPLKWDNMIESRSCVAQGIITRPFTSRETNAAREVASSRDDVVWISCTTYLLKGTAILQEDNSGGRLTRKRRPVGIKVDLRTNEKDTVSSCFAENDEVDNVNTYNHLGDGHYVPSSPFSTFDTSGDDDELWFGLEDGAWPRKLPAAIARYNANTLECLGIEFHPSSMYLAWLAYDAITQKAYGSTWENITELYVFGPSTNSASIHDEKGLLKKNYVWSTIPITNVPKEYQEQGGLNFIQGGTIIQLSADHRRFGGAGHAKHVSSLLYLMSDDYQSSLIELQLLEAEAKILSIHHLGLGNEREGIAFFSTNVGKASHLLSLGNRWRTWENHSFAEILCIPLYPFPSTNQLEFWMESYIQPILLVVSVAAILVLVSWIKTRRRDQQLQEQSYSPVRSQELVNIHANGN